jgi:hypothetical protein
MDKSGWLIISLKKLPTPTRVGNVCSKTWYNWVIFFGPSALQSTL